MSAQTSEPIATVGDVIAGKFRVERVLGEGGMGLVLEATHLLLDERVALKFLRPQVLLQKDIVARFAQEARAAAKLKSEHVARVLDVGEDRGIPYMVMELLEGKNLEELLAERGPLPLTDAVELLIQAAEGISEAHARGIIHRDLKPANLFLTERAGAWATLKILDFGISKAALSSNDVPAGPGKTMSLLGSPYYMSPEQLRSTRDVDRRTDLWSLGVVLYELLAGRTPFAATEFIPLVNDILEAPHTPLRELRPDVPEALAALVDRALAKDPADRFQSAGELALALLPFTTSKRSRVIASHAITLTRSSGIDPTLPLPSNLPPAISSDAMAAGAPSAPTSSSSRMAAASSGKVAVSPVSMTRKIDGGGATQPSFEIPSEALARSTPDPEGAPAAAAEPSARTRPPAAVLGLAIVLLAGGGLFFATRSGDTAGAPRAAAPAVPPPPAETAPAIERTAAATAQPGAVATAPAPAASDTATGAATSARPPAQTPAAPSASARRAGAVTGSPPTTGAAAAPTAGGDLEIRRER